MKKKGLLIFAGVGVAAGALGYFVAKTMRRLNEEFEAEEHDDFEDYFDLNAEQNIHKAPGAAETDPNIADDDAFEDDEDESFEAKEAPGWNID